MNNQFEVTSIQRVDRNHVGRIWRWLSMLLVVCAALLILGLAIWTMRVSEAALETNLKSKFNSILNIECEAVQQWVKSRKEMASYLAADQSILDLLTSEQGLESDTSYKPRVDNQLKNIVGRFNSNSCVLMTIDGTIIASTGADWLPAQLPELEEQYCRSLVSDRPIASAIFQPVSEVSTSVQPESESLETQCEEDFSRVLVVAAPITHEDGTPVGFLAMGLDAERELTKILASSAMGSTGETIAIDKDGWIISSTRDRSEVPRRSYLATPPLVSPHLGQSALNLDGQLDHRGKRVMSASRWLPRLDIGLVTKMDFDEASAPVSQVRSFIWTLGGLLILTTMSTFIYRLYIFRLRNAAQTEELDQQKLGPYELEEKVGEGGMGVVYRARHALLRRPTAVKLLPPDKSSKKAIERFEREVQFTSQLQHPNTISIYDYGRTDNGLFYYAMELLDGINLEQLVRTEKTIPDGRVIHILRQVGNSLAEAHRRGLIHRDIKPANIMLCDRGGAIDTVKVLDFGMVRTRRETRKSVSNALSGTPAYMAPEAFSAPNKIDARLDIFAVGAVAFYLLTGKPLLEVDDLAGLMRLHQTEIEIDTWEKLNAFSSEQSPICDRLSRLVARCVATNPDVRFPSIEAMLEELACCEPVSPWTLSKANSWWNESFTLADPDSNSAKKPAAAIKRGLAETQAFRVNPAQPANMAEQQHR